MASMSFPYGATAWQAQGFKDILALPVLDIPQEWNRMCGLSNQLFTLSAVRLGAPTVWPRQCFCPVCDWRTFQNR